jgi:hypothetical protein
MPKIDVLSDDQKDKVYNNALQFKHNDVKTFYSTNAGLFDDKYNCRCALIPLEDYKSKYHDLAFKLLKILDASNDVGIVLSHTKHEVILRNHALNLASTMLELAHKSTNQYYKIDIYHGVMAALCCYLANIYKNDYLDHFKTDEYNISSYSQANIAILENIAATTELPNLEQIKDILSNYYIYIKPQYTFKNYSSKRTVTLELALLLVKAELETRRKELFTLYMKKHSISTKLNLQNEVLLDSDNKRDFLIQVHEIKEDVFRKREEYLKELSGLRNNLLNQDKAIKEVKTKSRIIDLQGKIIDMYKSGNDDDGKLSDLNRELQLEFSKLNALMQNKLQN